jgi:hypothetical protein
MVEKELTIIESYDLLVAKRNPESRRSIKIFLEIISNLTDRLAEASKVLEEIANSSHQAYDGNASFISEHSSGYALGVADGHRCAAATAKLYLERI